MSLSTLILAIFYFTQDDPEQRITRALGINASLVSKIVKRLQDACSLDIMSRPFIPFGGPGTVVKCDESKFNHKAKVKLTRCSLFTVEFPNVLLPPTSFPGQFLTFCGGQPGNHKAKRKNEVALLGPLLTILSLLTVAVPQREKGCP